MNLKKKNNRDLYSFRWLKSKNPKVLPFSVLRGVGVIVAAIFVLLFSFIFFEIYVPLNPSSHESVNFFVEKGWGDDRIADELKKAEIIRSSAFFKFYVIVSLKHSALQAGEYNLSPKMSIHDIASKMATGGIIRDKIVILEGWNKHQISKYLGSKNICSQDEFLAISNEDFSEQFDFLASKPANVSLEGYLFPDTYELSKGDGCREIIEAMLMNFSRKIKPELKEEITRQGKSLFEIITVASMIEKEVRGADDKKIVSGIMWRRLAIGMPLQIDATVNYVTGKNDPAVLIKDTQIDSPYNTYKYPGLPKGPISNPGIDSIMAAIYPVKTKYLYYLSNGKTYFSETFEQHVAAKAIYLK